MADPLGPAAAQAAGRGRARRQGWHGHHAGIGTGEQGRGCQGKGGGGVVAGHGGRSFVIGVPGAALWMPNFSNDGLWLMTTNREGNNAMFTTILLG
jgi:hypothetical protein